MLSHLFSCFLYIFIKRFKILLFENFTALLVIFCLGGLNTHHQKTSNTFYSVDEKKEETMFEVLSFIQSEYLEKENIYSVVYWDPDFYFPRQNVTYLGDFKVLNNWEEGEELEPLYLSVDFIVSQKKFQIPNNNIAIKEIDDLNIYFVKNE